MLSTEGLLLTFTTVVHTVAMITVNNHLVNDYRYIFILSF